MTKIPVKAQRTRVCQRMIVPQMFVYCQKCSPYFGRTVFLIETVKSFWYLKFLFLLLGRVFHVLCVKDFNCLFLLFFRGLGGELMRQAGMSGARSCCPSLQFGGRVFSGQARPPIPSDSSAFLLEILLVPWLAAVPGGCECGLCIFEPQVLTCPMPVYLSVLIHAL